MSPTFTELMHSPLSSPSSSCMMSHPGYQQDIVTRRLQPTALLLPSHHTEVPLHSSHGHTNIHCIVFCTPVSQNGAVPPPPPARRMVSQTSKCFIVFLISHRHPSAIGIPQLWTSLSYRRSLAIDVPQLQTSLSYRRPLAIDVPQL